MNYSVFWARLLGLYATILAIWCFVNMNHLTGVLTDLVNNPLMMMSYGIYTIPLGLAIVISHPIFKGWPLLVTLLGYLITLKGIILLFYPHYLSQVLVFWRDNMFITPMPALLIGVALLYCGFVHKS